MIKLKTKDDNKKPSIGKSNGYLPGTIFLMQLCGCFGSDMILSVHVLCVAGASSSTVARSLSTVHPGGDHSDGLWVTAGNEGKVARDDTLPFVFFKERLGRSYRIGAATSSTG